VAQDARVEIQGIKKTPDAGSAPKA
jgi:hypothetical protein